MMSADIASDKLRKLRAIPAAERDADCRRFMRCLAAKVAVAQLLGAPGAVPAGGDRRARARLLAFAMQLDTLGTMFCSNEIHTWDAEELCAAGSFLPGRTFVTAGAELLSRAEASGDVRRLARAAALVLSFARR